MQNDHGLCSICFGEFICPVKLECSHVFDITCIGRWFEKNKSCPLCRRSLTCPPEFAIESFTKPFVWFKPKFLSARIIDKFPVSFDASCQDVKTIITAVMGYQSWKFESPCLAIWTQIGTVYISSITDEMVVKPTKIDPKEYLFYLHYYSANGKRLDRKFYSDLKLSNFKLQPKEIYALYGIRKYAQYGDPCDRCFKKPELEKTCTHKIE